MFSGCRTPPDSGKLGAGRRRRTCLRSPHRPSSRNASQRPSDSISSPPTGKIGPVADFAPVLELPDYDAGVHLDPVGEPSDLVFGVHGVDANDERLQRANPDEEVCRFPVGPLPQCRLLPLRLPVWLHTSLATETASRWRMWNHSCAVGKPGIASGGSRVAVAGRGAQPAHGVCRLHHQHGTAREDRTLVGGAHPT